jgi:hypothetical protein
MASKSLIKPKLQKLHAVIDDYACAFQHLKQIESEKLASLLTSSNNILIVRLLLLFLAPFFFDVCAFFVRCRLSPQLLL